MVCIKVGSTITKGFAFRESDKWNTTTLVEKIENEGMAAFGNLLPVRFTPCDMSNFKSNVENFISTHSGFNLKVVYLVDVESSSVYKSESTREDFENLGRTSAKWT